MATAAPSLTLPLLPTPGGVVLPEQVVTIALESDEARAAADAATDNLVLLVPKVDGRFATVGVVAHVEHRGALRSGTPAITVRATGRAVLGAGVVGTASGSSGSSDALWVTAELVPDPVPTSRTAELVERYRAVAGALIEALGGRPLLSMLPGPDAPGALADTIAYWPELSMDRRVELLEALDVDDRLTKATAWGEEALASLALTKQVHEQVEAKLESDQREALLRRQLAAIQAELGNGEGDVLSEYRARVAALDEQGAFTPAVRDAITKEIDRFERVGEQSQEGSWIRTWLDEVLGLPWGERTVDHLDLVAARDVLDADHTGLDEVKERIVEHLAVRKLRAERAVDDGAEHTGSPVGGSAGTGSARGSRTILALAGPPGVGKTSLGESIAHALGRRFVRLALGGIRDEAEIRGHRRTYVGARPGRVVRALAEAGTMNPVVLLDEIDKLGADWRGDPSAALLEVLDPAQNHSFRDHYLEFELDLSDVIFIATANRLDTIPGPLLDRLELIQLDGYTDAEKAVIAREHIVPKLRERMGLRDDEVVLADDVVERVAADWTREAGVRSLERALDKLLRKAATTIATRGSGSGAGAEDTGAEPVVVTVDDLRDALGKPIPREEIADRVAVPGVATGLAVTGAGGDVLFVEAAAMDGDPGLTLTGQLGDVMKESAEIARSWLRANASRLGIDEPNRRLHVHFPAGAVPKDGPSAGVTMTTALASLLTGRVVRPEVGMTGEVSLQGRVLPIGGVKQKVLAAHRAGLTEVILPARNGEDLDDVPAEVRDALTIHLVETVDQVLDLALAPAA